MCATTPLSQHNEQTRARLLTAARAVFSECGFQGATVREICRRAEANVAAVNYHFGSKDGLLAEALNFAPLKAMQQANVTVDACPKIRLRLFIRDFMLMLLDENNASAQCQIMARELADPTPALDQIVSEAIAPLHQHVATLAREILGSEASDIQVQRHVNSILGQCLFYRHSQPVLQRLHPDSRYDKATIKAIAQHIAEVALAGLAQSATPAR